MGALLQEAVELMAAGMGVVFIFLFILTGVVSLLTRLCPAIPSQGEQITSTKQTDTLDKSETAKRVAVAIAVQKYRQAQGRAESTEE